MASATVLAPIPQGTTAEVSGQLVDAAGAAISSADLTAFTLTLRHRFSGVFINGRNAQTVLNANNVTVDTSGNVVWVVQPQDAVILDPAKDVDEHEALFTWTYAGGAKKGAKKFHLQVANTSRIP